MNQQQEAQDEPIISVQDFEKLSREDKELFVSVLSEKEKKSVAGLFTADKDGKVKWCW